MPLQGGHSVCLAQPACLHASHTHDQIYCAQLCSTGRASMAGGVLVVESQAAYDKWLAAKAGATTSFE